MKLSRISIVLIFVGAVLFLTEPGFCSADRNCRCSYQRQDATQSQKYTLNVTFATGQELNEATNSFRFNAFSKYASIWFGQGQCALVRLNGMIMTSGSTIEDSDLDNILIKRLTGSDQNGVLWEIVLPSFGY